MIKAENPVCMGDTLTTFNYVRSKFNGEKNFKNPQKIKEWFENYDEQFKGRVALVLYDEGDKLYKKG